MHNINDLKNLKIQTRDLNFQIPSAKFLNRLIKSMMCAVMYSGWTDNYGRKNPTTNSFW